MFGHDKVWDDEHMTYSVKELLYMCDCATTGTVYTLEPERACRYDCKSAQWKPTDCEGCNSFVPHARHVKRFERTIRL